MRIRNLSNRIYGRRNKVVVALIILSFILIGLGWSMMSSTNEISGIVTESENGDSEWKTYTNEQYNFKISFPKDWKVYEEFANTSPIINIYKPKFDKRPPFDHFSDVNSISIFPQGVETEALIGEVAPFETEVALSATLEVENITEYILKNGVIWARYVTFSSVPENWKPWGSVWSRAEISNLEFSCSNGETDIPVEECNPFGGDIFIREGRVDPAITEIQEQILETLEFLDEE